MKAALYLITHDGENPHRRLCHPQKHARTVLHLVAPGLSEHEITSDVIAQPQDESEYHDQQIWWIEPLPDEETAGAEALGASYFYTITNPCSMKVLKMTGTPGM